ncbi:MAG: hypothetical protein AABZ78_09870 [Chloroflexota bacterium]
MYDILKDQEDDRLFPVAADISIAALDPQPDDLWLFTDPIAKELYTRQNKLDQLQEDILRYAMCNGRWAANDLKFFGEVQRLLRDKTIIPKGTLGYRSPHPTVYRAVRESAFEIAGRKFHFEIGNDLVFEPWLARVSTPSSASPVRIGKFRTVANFCLCGDAFPRASMLCDKALEILRQTLRS